ncbi:MAG TPA: DUF4386 domain-containing protein [Allosphingosinicella sp.]|nr:DUF4386 domain-containing protein [Allosphingosinicella sp.]
MIETSVKSYSRAVGIFLILTMFGGFFGEVYVPSQMSGADAAARIAQLRTHEDLFRVGFAGYMVEAFSDVVLAWLFYVLLRPVHRDLALLSAFFGIISMTLFAATQMFYFTAPMFLGGSRYLAHFSGQELEGLASAFLSISGYLSGVFMLFYGSAWIVRGYLTFKSGYLPRFLGLLMLVAGAGFVAQNITKVLAPAYSSSMLLAPMFLNVVVLAIWMLTKGVNRDKWHKALRAEGDRLGADANRQPPSERQQHET